MIMDGATGAGSALDLNDSGQIHQTEQVVELNTTTDPLPQTEEELPIPHSLSHSQILPSTSASSSSLTPIAIPSKSVMSVAAKRGIPRAKNLNITPVSSHSNVAVGGREVGGCECVCWCICVDVHVHVRMSVLCMYESDCKV